MNLFPTLFSAIGLVTGSHSCDEFIKKEVVQNFESCMDNLNWLADPNKLELNCSTFSELQQCYNILHACPESIADELLANSRYLDDLIDLHDGACDDSGVGSRKRFRRSPKGESRSSGRSSRSSSKSSKSKKSSKIKVNYTASKIITTGFVGLGFTMAADAKVRKLVNSYEEDDCWAHNPYTNQYKCICDEQCQLYGIVYEEINGGEKLSGQTIFVILVTTLFWQIINSD